MGSYVFTWPHPGASEVHVTGTFDDWGKSVTLEKVGDVWRKEVELPTDKKVLYKFVIDDKEWTINTEAPQEDDGHGNLNNVLYPDQIKPKAELVPEALTTSSAAPESTTAALAGQVPLEPKKEATEGTFPETPANETESFSVNPLPATEGTGNPINLPAGEKLPASSELTSNTVDSNVTTSKEEYEKAGSGIPIIGGALAALGLGGTAAAVSKKENLIPESSLPIGTDANTLDAGPTLSSAGPTSTTAALAGQVPLEETKPASEVPEVVKESIEEAHASPEASASAEAVMEKAEVEQELLKKVPSSDEAGEPAPTIAAATSETAPAPTSSDSGAVVPGTSSAAAAAVSDGAETSETTEAPKTTVVPEKTEGDNTEYAPPVSTTAAPGVSASAAAAISDGTEDPTLADEPAVKLMNQNEAEASATETPAATTSAHTATTVTDAPKTEATTEPAPEAKKEEAPATSAPSTPQKATTTPADTPTSSATKEKKKKHRISSFFKKILN